MAEPKTARIARELMDEPHVAGRRISVLQLHDFVEGRGDSPEEVAETFDLDLADVYHALAYYHDNREEMETVREKRRELFESIDIDRPPGVNPPN